MSDDTPALLPDLVHDSLLFGNDFIRFAFPHNHDLQRHLHSPPLAQADDAVTRPIPANLFDPIMEAFPSITAFQTMPCPYIISPPMLDALEQTALALNAAIPAFIRKWHEDSDAGAQLRAILNLPCHIQSLFKEHAVDSLPLTFGTMRPDVVMISVSSFRVCEINARFSLNGFLMSAHINEALRIQVRNKFTYSSSIYSRLCYVITYLVPSLDHYFIFPVAGGEAKDAYGKPSRHSDSTYPRPLVKTHRARYEACILQCGDCACWEGEQAL